MGRQGWEVILSGLQDALLGQPLPGLGPQGLEAFPTEHIKEALRGPPLKAWKVILSGL
jgi:hypothetical protein